jgi:hypothetical protein
MPPAAVDPAPPDRGEDGVRVPDREARNVEADRLARRPSVEDAQQRSAIASTCTAAAR